MRDAFLSLTARDRRDALGVASDRSGRPVHLLEKDIWVVWALSALFASPVGDHLVFKGGTSLSKAYGAISRFSEDVDITYDIRQLLPGLDGVDKEPLPPSRSQEKRWTNLIRASLTAWVRDRAFPVMQSRLAADSPTATLEMDDGVLRLRYAPTTLGTGYVQPVVRIEFGGRSTGEPAREMAVSCDAAPHVEAVAFPEASPRVMVAERTFWEKATAAHVFCCQARSRGDRYVRHWHDLVRLDDHGYAALAIVDRVLARRVARHKTAFFPEKSAAGTPISYLDAVTGHLRLVPSAQAAAALRDDYDRMRDDGLFLEDPEPFDDLMARCRDLAARANAVATG